MDRRVGMAAGAVGFLALLLAAVVWAIPSIERDLTDRAEQELAASSIDDIVVGFDGRNGSVSGPEAIRAEEALSGLDGARWVRADQVEPPTPTSAPPPQPASVDVTRTGTVVRLEGIVETEADRQAMVRQVIEAGLDVDDALEVDADVDGSDVRLLVPMVGPVLDGSDDGEITLADGNVIITGAAADPVEAEEIQAAVDDAELVGLSVDNAMTTVVLSEDAQIVALQVEIDQIFELARAIEGQNPAFDVSEEQLSPTATEVLDRVVVAMRRYPLPAADIIGHTDDLDTEEFNQTLSEARALTVKNHLVDQGVDEARLTSSGRGETEPIADNETEAGRNENRRVDFIVRRSGE